MNAYTYARELAKGTPETRNRFVDFLRAASIIVVVLGHWLMAAPQVTPAGLEFDHLLSVTTWTHYLTWTLQVMPIFFLVGGFANAVSWRSARARSDSYALWLRGRLRRLLLPVLPLLAVWAVGAYILLRSGFDPNLIRVSSQAALVPIWFLATYIAVVALVPPTLGIWDRHGWTAIVTGVALAGLLDLLSLGLGLTLVGLLNYLVVWGTVHALGYAWADSRIGSVAQRLFAGFLGLVATAGLVLLGPYPVAMVGLDTQGVNNSQPPKVTLITLAVFQAGLLLALEGPARKWLAGVRVWTWVVLVNGRIMTIYLWHLTAMMALIGASLLIGGYGLDLEVDTPAWWLSRLAWIGLLVLTTIPFILVFGRFERPSPDPRPSPPAWQTVAAVIVTCAGLGLLALLGISDEDGLNGLVLSLPFAAALAGGIAGARRWERKARARRSSGTAES